MSKGKTKEGLVLLIDIGQKTSEKDQNDQSFLDKSKLCASRIVERKIFSDSKDEMGIVLIGSETTDNEMEYPNVNVRDKNLLIPNLNMLRFIDKLTPSDETSDWLDGLIAAIGVLRNDSEYKQLTELKIILFSNFATPINSVDRVDDVIETLTHLKIKIVAIGSQGENQDEDGTSENQTADNKGLAFIGRILDESGGLMCTFEEAMLQLDHAEQSTGRAQTWNCDFQIGSNIYIPISGYKKYAPKKYIKWSKKSVNNKPVVQETVFFQGDDQVEKTDVINSYLFGQTVVPISEDDRSSIKLETEKCFQLIGFTQKKNVPCHMYIGDSAHYITARKGSKEAEEALTALAKSLMESNRAGVVRKVYCKNASPRLGAIIPVCERGAYFFYFVPLPFSEDERSVKLPSLNKVKPNQQQLDAVDSLIDSMDLSQYDEDEDPYSKLYNPTVEKENKSIVFKALNPESPLSELPKNITSLLQPKEEILENASSALDKVKDLFPLEEVEQKKYRRGAADAFEKNGNDIPTTNGNDHQNLADSITNFVHSAVTEVGTIDPEGNFLKLLEQGEPFKKVCKQMQTAIKKLLLTLGNGINLQKPLSAIKLLREYSIKNNPTFFNGFISQLKDELVEGNSEFWSFIVKDKLGLITRGESENSNITTEDADVFYSVKKSETQAEEYELEAEDMLDMI